MSAGSAPSCVRLRDANLLRFPYHAPRLNLKVKYSYAARTPAAWSDRLAEASQGV
jgi:hypothetical protein